jgi:hypothetical protein
VFPPPVRGALLALPLSALHASASAQDPSFHARLRDNLGVLGAKNSDVWSDGTVAYKGRSNQPEFDVFDVSDPDQIALLATFTMPPPNETASTEDNEVGTVPLDRSKKLLFVTLEENGNDGVAIFDVTDPAAPVQLTRVDVGPGTYADVHTLTYRDDGWLVLCDGRDPTVALIDLRAYDPANPPATITSWTYELTGLGTGFAHEATLTDDRLYIAAWDNLYVYDAGDLANAAPTYLGSVRELAGHSAVPSEDGRFLAATAERGGGAVHLYEIVDGGSTVTLLQRDSFVNPPAGIGFATTPHIPWWQGDRLYVSNYQAGVLVLQLDRTTKTFERVASFDTSVVTVAGYKGCWGVDPRLGADRVLASDLENGLFTLDFSALEISFPTARPELVAPGATTPLAFRIDALGTDVLDPSTVEIHARTDGGAFVPAPATDEGGGLFTATLPAGTCGGRIDYFLAARDVSGEPFTSPASAPAAYHTAWSSSSLTTVFADDFETDRGWTVTNDLTLTGGAWERAEPLDTGAQGGYDSDDAGSSCYVTQNGLPGANANAFDVDGGPTVLESPLLDFSAGDGLVSFSRWSFSNADPTDGLRVEVSNDGGDLYVPVELVVLKGGGWLRDAFRVSDFVAPSAEVRVRFSVADLPANSTTEAALDDFRAEVFACAGPQATAVFRNGAGVNPPCYSASAPVIGASWVGQVDASSVPGATFTLVSFYASGTSGTLFSGGELLVDLASPRFSQSLVVSSGGVDTHQFFVPNDPSLAGALSASQGIVLGGAGWQACNAFDLAAGY